MTELFDDHVMKRFRPLDEWSHAEFLGDPTREWLTG